MVVRYGRHPGRGAARGTTVLEAVLAAGLLALLATATFAVLGSMHRQHVRHQQLLGAVELCNRLVVMYLDDPDTLPSRYQPIGYGRYTYRHDMSVEKIDLEPATAEGQRRVRGPGPVDRVGQLEQVTVRVWLDEPSAAGRGGAPVPSATIVRLVDPLNIMRNPDSAQNLIETERGQNRLIRQLLGLEGNQPLPAAPEGQEPRRARPPGSGASRPGPGGGR